MRLCRERRGKINLHGFQLSSGRARRDKGLLPTNETFDRKCSKFIRDFLQVSNLQLLPRHAVQRLPPFALYRGGSLGSLRRLSPSVDGGHGQQRAILLQSRQGGRSRFHQDAPCAVHPRLRLDLAEQFVVDRQAFIGVLSCVLVPIQGMDRIESVALGERLGSRFSNTEREKCAAQTGTSTGSFFRSASRQPMPERATKSEQHPRAQLSSRGRPRTVRCASKAPCNRSLRCVGCETVEFAQYAQTPRCCYATRDSSVCLSFSLFLSHPLHEFIEKKPKPLPQSLPTAPGWWRRRG